VADNQVTNSNPTGWQVTRRTRPGDNQQAHRQSVSDTSSKLIDSWAVDKQLSDRKPDDKQQAHRHPGGKQPGSRQPSSRQPSDRHARQPTSLLPATVPVCAACDVNLDHAGSPIGDNAGVNTGNRLGNTKLPALCERAMYT